MRKSPTKGTPMTREAAEALYKAYGPLPFWVQQLKTVEEAVKAMELRRKAFPNLQK